MAKYQKNIKYNYKLKLKTVRYLCSYKQMDQ